MASFLTLPFMFWLGLIAVAAPIIIHLLNRRRFRIIEWAAMEFLLNANKKNRRRIQLENIILLLLRCVAMFLLGLLLARPFFPNDANLFGDNQQFERIVVLDDSYSMNVRVGNKTLFEVARDKIKEFAQVLAKDKASNTLSIYLASDMEQPAVTNMDVTAETLTEIQDSLDELQCSDFAAHFDEGLQAMVDATSSRSDAKNRIFYLVTDLRQRDWWSSDQAEDGHPAQKMLKAIARNTPLGCYLVDVGQEVDNVVNLAITDIRPESAINSGVDTTFHVTVTNFGDQAVRDVRLDFFEAEGAVPKSEMISVLPPGESESIVKSFPVTYELEAPASYQDPDVIANQVGYWKVSAALHVDDIQQDLVEVDSQRYYAAKVKRGLSVLLVDGDPSAIEDRSETYYLRRALRPVDANSGLLPTVVGVTELSSVDFTKYQIVYLCNVDELSEGQLETLENWVREGGSLVMMLGDQINELIFNRQFYFDPEKAKRHLESKSVTPAARLQGGIGLSPLKLLGMEGDVNRETWVNLDLGETRSPVTRVFEGQGNIAISLVNFYSWWNSTETGFMPVSDPVSPLLKVGHHYKFGPRHAQVPEFSEGQGGASGNSISGNGEVTEKMRVLEVDSGAIEIGAEFVISDVLGQFDRFPIKLRATDDARFSMDGNVTSELVLNKLPQPASSEQQAYGCWRFTYANGDVWQVTAEKAENVEDRGENTRILARYNDEASNIAIAEKRFGEGRVVAFTFPADEDWTNLPQIGSANIIMHLQMCEYLAAKESLEEGKVGDPIVSTIDISRFDANALVEPPRGEKQNVKAVAGKSSEGLQAKYQEVIIPQMTDSGFYVMNLSPREKGADESLVEQRVFAANVDPVEGDLRRLDIEGARKGYFGDEVKIISGPSMSSQTVQGARTEYWMYILFFLGGVLVLEQFLGWWFGRRR